MLRTGALPAGARLLLTLVLGSRRRHDGHDQRRTGVAPRGAVVHSSCTETRKGLADTTANPLLLLGLFGGLDGI